MLKRGSQNGLVFLISFLVVFASSIPFSYSRSQTTKKVKVKNLEAASGEDKSKDELEPIVPATNITIFPKPILVKPTPFPQGVKTARKPVVPQPLKLEKPVLTEPIRVTTLTKPDLAKIEATDLPQDATTTTINKSKSADKQEE